MKLPIKRKYFDQIKKGEKIFEFRDAHATFVAEDNGETLTVPIMDVKIVHVDSLSGISPEEKKELFTDKRILRFWLGDNLTERERMIREFLDNGLCGNKEHGHPCNRMIKQELCKYCGLPVCFPNFAYHICSSK